MIACLSCSEGRAHLFDSISKVFGCVFLLNSRCVCHFFCIHFFRGTVFKSISYSSDLEVWFHFERNCPNDLKSSVKHFSHKGYTSVSSYAWKPLTESSVNLCPMTDEQYESYRHRIETRVSCLSWSVLSPHIRACLTAALALLWHAYLI